MGSNISRKRSDIKRILLVGNPNVGKRALFSRLTGNGEVAIIKRIEAASE